MNLIACGRIREHVCVRVKISYLIINYFSPGMELSECSLSIQDFFSNYRLWNSELSPGYAVYKYVHVQ